MEVKYLRPTDELIEHIASDMREADQEEIWVSSHATPYQALRDGMRDSDLSVVISINDEPCVMIGVVRPSLLSTGGVIWMLGTEGALKYKKKFLTEVPKVMADIFKVFSFVYNYVYIKNTVSIQWLEWIGFSFDPAAPFGIEGEMFHKFYLERKDYV